MSQLLSVRSNQSLEVSYEHGKLIPLTEIIILTEKPKYSLEKDDKILKGNEITEVRFKCSSAGLGALIDQLQSAKFVAEQYERIAADITVERPTAGTPVKSAKKSKAK